MLAAFYRSVLFHDDSKIFVFGYVAAAVVLAIWLGLFWLAAVVGVHLVLEIVKQHHYDPRPVPVLARSLWELKLDIGLVLCGLVISLYIGVVLGAAGIGAAGRVGVQAAARVGLWQRGLRGALLTLDDVAMVVKARSVSKKDAAEGEADTATTTGTPAEDEPVAARAVAAGRAPDARESAERSRPHGVAAAVGPTPAGSDAPAAPAAATSEAVEKLAEPPHPPPVPPTGGAELWGGWAEPRWSRGDRISLAFTVASLALILAAPLLTDHTLGSTWAEILHEMHPFPG